MGLTANVSTTKAPFYRWENRHSPLPNSVFLSIMSSGGPTTESTFLLSCLMTLHRFWSWPLSGTDLYSLSTKKNSISFLAPARHKITVWRSLMWRHLAPSFLFFTDSCNWIVQNTHPERQDHKSQRRVGTRPCSMILIGSLVCFFLTSIMSTVLVISNALGKDDGFPKGPVICGIKSLQTNWDATGTKGLFLGVMIKLPFPRLSPQTLMWLYSLQRFAPPVYLEHQL